ncbi:type VI secretion system baseplate subunit TssK [Pigmentibacter ruber]|uniref:type VI secretion system baseplate subunit TssK n=1 Tax=Pigmentibacter ruber TaxID=2683196 RepID=UPI00131CA058|nr:type VI secretion system baseplate subunit TssK [Pigmentibacter ruber]BFD32847.1 type VI secretion system baseplate subunit TssK [Pigmentibacter ruber]
MKSLKDIPDKVMWHDGMLLSPQHFQQAFSRVENIFQFSMNQNLYYPFGIINLRYEENTFTNGLLKIEELECIFQDGLEYYFNSFKDKFSLEFDLTKYKDLLIKKPLTLVVCVPKNEKNNYILNSTFSRYKSVNIDAYSLDENTGEDEIYIPRLKPNVSLAFEHELVSNYLAIPIAKVYVENSFYKTELFTPPITKVTSSSEIWKICNSICMLLRYKIQDIMEDIHKFENDDFKSIFFSRKESLKNLKLCLPKFEAFVYSEQMHPFHLYLALYDVYSSITSNDIDELPKSLINYDHFNIMSSFQKLQQLIIEFLEREIPTGFKLTKISKVDKRFQTTVFTNENTVDNQTHIILGFKKNYSVSHDNFSNWIKSAVICDEELYNSTIERKSLGLSRTIIEKYDSLIPKKSMYLVYIKLEGIKKDKINLIISSSVQENIQYQPQEVILYSRK